VGVYESVYQTDPSLLRCTWPLCDSTKERHTTRQCLCPSRRRCACSTRDGGEWSSASSGSGTMTTFPSPLGEHGPPGQGRGVFTFTSQTDVLHTHHPLIHPTAPYRARSLDPIASGCATASGHVVTFPRLFSASSAFRSPHRQASTIAARRSTPPARPV
jgi:hypothetical protein